MGKLSAMTMSDRTVDNTQTRRPCVLVFAGHDPSGGAGMAS